ERLGRRAQIELRAAGELYGPRRPIERDRLPARRRQRAHRRTVLGDLLEVAVVADTFERLADGRVDGSAREPRSIQRDLDRLEHEGARLRRRPCGTVEPGELGI